MKRKAVPKTGQHERRQETDLYTHIGEKIRSHREARDWSQAELAEAVSVTPNTVSRWETAAYRPSAADLDGVARAFGVPLWAFFPSTVEAPTEAQKALLSAAGDLPPEDLEELQRFADFIRARRTLKGKGNKK